MAAAFIPLMDHNFLNQVMEHSGGKFIKSGVLFCYLEEAVNVDGFAVYLCELGLNILNLTPKGLLFLLVIGREYPEPFIGQLSSYGVLIQPLDDVIQIVGPVFFLRQFLLQ